MRILGIDPGLATTGWAVVDFDKDGNPNIVDFGAIITGKEMPISQRLKEIYEDILDLVNKFNPNFAGIETLLFYNNAKTAMVVAEARGVVRLALGQNGIPTEEFTPLQVKNAVTGYGKADKRQVQENVQILCNLESIPKPDDAADAIAIAITTNRVV